MDINLIINGTDFSDKIKDFNFLDRRNITEYIFSLDETILTPLPSNSSFTVMINNETLFENSTDIEYELATRETGSIIRIRIDKMQ